MQSSRDVMSTALLIEDDARIARLLRLELDRSGWMVRWEPTGNGGWNAAQDGSHYDLVILDLMLPDLDGLTVCRSLRELSSLPILILTARGAVHERVMGLDAGADDYLVKPFATTELLARMRALLRRREGAAASGDWLVAKNFELSVLRHEVRVSGVPLELTPREFKLLAYFMENMGMALTREMILDHIWGWGHRGSSAIVDVYVGYLRHKLEQTSADLHIVTIRRVGYSLRDSEDGR